MTKPVPPIEYDHDPLLWDFIQRALDKNLETRYTTEQLINHEFLRDAEGLKGHWRKELDDHRKYVRAKQR